MFNLLRRFRTETKSLADPSEDLAALFGLVPSSSTGVTVTASAALRVPAVSSAIRVISEAAACLDVAVKRRGGDGTETALQHPVQRLLTGQVNDWTSGYEMIRDLVIDALSDDRGGLVHVNRVNGEVRELIRYRSGVISVELDAETGEPRYQTTARALPARDVIHLRAPFGRAPLSLAREAIATALALDAHAGKLFGRGARPAGVLKFPKGMGEESVKKARAAWRATHEGTDSNGQTAILYDGAEFEPLTFNSTDAQFLENRNFQILEVARAFRVPPSMLFQLDRATWSNTEQMGQEFLVYCLEPWLKALEGALARALLTEEERAEGLVIRFDRDDLTRADLATRSTVINSLVSARVINPNEGRESLGLPAYEGGEAFANPNITTATAADDAADNAPPAAEEALDAAE